MNLAVNGTEPQREAALQAMQFDNSFRVARTVRSTARTLIGSRAATIQEIHPWLGGTPSTQRTIFDAHHRQRLPGTPVREETDGPTGDDATDEAFDNMGDTFDLYWNVYGRNSIDNAGMPLVGTVHYGRNYDNAFWDGDQMVYGDGDGVQFQRFTKSIDVVGHELTHGVTESEARLLYWAQSGALNESISDVFGSLVKQYTNNEKADEADWLIGEGLFVDGAVQGVALRSLAAPGTAYDDPVLGKDPQPSSMADYDPTWTDSAGVHINSGIPNHAFYLLAIELGGPAWETAGLIWYKTLLSRGLQPSAQFVDFARITLRQARRLFGLSSNEADAVRHAWNAVGISV